MAALLSTFDLSKADEGVLVGHLHLRGLCKATSDLRVSEGLSASYLAVANDVGVVSKTHSFEVASGHLHFRRAIAVMGTLTSLGVRSRRFLSEALGYLLVFLVLFVAA